MHIFFLISKNFIQKSLVCIKHALKAGIQFFLINKNFIKEKKKGVNTSTQAVDLNETSKN